MQQFMERCAMEDYTWDIPSRHHQHLGLYLPSMESSALTEFVFVVDTSGSVNQRILNVFAAELSKATSVLPIEKFHILYCDTKVQKVETYTRGEEPVKIRPVGGGGTDFRPPFEWVEEQGINPKGLVYLTDLRCSRFPNPPAYPVLWVVYGNKREVPFGEVIPLGE